MNELQRFISQVKDNKRFYFDILTEYTMFIELYLSNLIFSICNLSSKKFDTFITRNWWTFVFVDILKINSCFSLLNSFNSNSLIHFVFSYQENIFMVYLSRYNSILIKNEYLVQFQLSGPKINSFQKDMFSQYIVWQYILSDSDLIFK